MRFKRAVLILFAITLPASMAGGRSDAFSQRPDCNRIKAEDDGAHVIKLDLSGTRGIVVFRHRHHESYLNPDGQFAHQAQRGAECIGCHHNRRESSGVPVLVKCATCHRGEGDPQNPKSRDFDEVWSERAFHDLCIGCHRASNEKGLAKCSKAPVACSECHAPKS